MGDRLNTQLSKNEETLLASMIGKRFDGYRCDEFFIVREAYGTLGFFVEGQAYELTNYTQPEDHYFGYREDVSRFAIAPVRKEDLKSAFVNVEQVNHVIGDTVQDVLLIQETETMVKRSGVIHLYEYTRAIIFCFPKYQLAFERSIDFSEEMYIIQGANTLDELGPVD